MTQSTPTPTPSSQSDNKKESSNSSRWWEYYLVRYFVGTVVGTLLIIFLVYDNNSKIHSLVPSLGPINLTEFEPAYLWLFGLIGLAFCYIASAPILVLHSFRSSIFREKFEWTSPSILRLAVALLFASLACYLIMHYYIGNFKTSIVLPKALFFVIFGIQFLLIIVEIVLPALDKFYNDLTTKRADKTNDARNEIVESYRHLREHGNAFMILLMEIIFSIILYHIDNYDLLITTLILWILPSAIVWFVGSYLEKKFIY